jgi:Fe-S-cluster containining protein
VPKYKMEIDLEKIKKFAEKREDENWEFRTFLKGYDGRNLDSMVHKLVQKYSDSIDCTACGNCCIEIQPILKKNDINALSKSLNISPIQFKKEYVQKDKDGDDVFTQLPCPFLSDNKCSHYDSRPSACKSFPHIHKKHFTARLIGVMHNYSVCPIVFNVYEELKNKLKPDFIEFQEIFGEFDY